MEKEVVVVGRDVAVSISTTMLMVYNMIDSKVWVVVVMIYIEEQRRGRRRCLLVEVVEEGIIIYGKEGKERKGKSRGTRKGGRGGNLHVFCCLPPLRQCFP